MKASGMRGLRGRGALISGGTRGIGLAAAHRLVQEGSRVFLTGVDADELRLAIQETGAVAGCVCDVADEAQVTAAVEAAEEATGGISVLLNNAGIARRDHFLDLPVAE